MATETEQDRENQQIDEFNIDEINMVVADLRMMGDLLISAGSSPDQVCDDTPSQSGWFVIRQADRLKELLAGAS